MPSGIILRLSDPSRNELTTSDDRCYPAVLSGAKVPISSPSICQAGDLIPGPQTFQRAGKCHGDERQSKRRSNTRPLRGISMNSVVSVNVGLPRDVEWQGKLVHTAVWKKPVPGRVMARRLNLDGDGQGDLAGHGGEHRAVMVYQLDSYRYWKEQLQRDDFEYGQFGENLTVDGLPDNEVCIGDRYQIGTALFEVTQPRVTCYRVGIRMANPQMPSLLVSQKRPGFYLRVLQEGEISAGDVIVKVADGPENVTVAEIDALLYLPGHPREQL